MPSLIDILRIYQGSNGDATKALYVELERLGPAGVVAMNLFRACKASERAKVYRGRGYRDQAYQRKEWSMGLLCAALVANPGALLPAKVAIEAAADVALAVLNESETDMPACWGWGIDAHMQERGDPHHHVLYIDLPTGQVSFHTGRRADGPDYPGEWDGVRNVQVDRICRWTASLFNQEES